MLLFASALHAKNHTADYLQHALASTLQDWGLEETSQTDITTDSGSNIRLACTLLGWKRISCFGHNLDLAVQKCLDNQRITRVLQLCRQIVAAFSSCWKRMKRIAGSARTERNTCENTAY